jgi:hypothetical protein
VERPTCSSISSRDPNRYFDVSESFESEGDLDRGARPGIGVQALEFDRRPPEPGHLSDRRRHGRCVDLTEPP